MIRGGGCHPRQGGVLKNRGAGVRQAEVPTGNASSLCPGPVLGESWVRTKMGHHKLKTVQKHLF